MTPEERQKYIDYCLFQLPRLTDDALRIAFGVIHKFVDIGKFNPNK